MDKLEKHIKERLEDRTIAPSKGAWDKIASQVKEPAPRKRNTWFPYAIAASVVGIVLVSVFFFTKGDAEVEQIQVVDTETKTETQTQFEDRKVKELVKDEQTEVTKTKSEPVAPEKTEEFASKTPVSNTAIVEEEVKEPLRDEIKINSDRLIAQKVEEVVAQVQIMETAQQDVSDAEVDSLLRAAQRQILTDKLFTEGGPLMRCHYWPKWRMNWTNRSETKSLMP